MTMLIIPPLPRNHYEIYTNSKMIFPRNRESCNDVFVKNDKINNAEKLQGSKQDIKYRKEICESQEISPFKIESVMGPDEFKDVIISNTNRRSFYITGERPKDKAGIPDSNGLENVKMKIFGANLHNHSVNSDGSLTVYEILEQAADYADKYTPVNQKPFIIGITDHNTVEGCKEAVNIIAENPDKYKNIRVVLGVEISAKEDELNGYKFKKAEKYHILSMCINPFDERLNNFLNDLQAESHSPMRVKTISIQEAFDGVKHQPQCFFALAHPAWPDITHRIRNDRNPYEVTREKMKYFKDITKDRGLYTELYYGSYFGNLATDEMLYKTIEQTCDSIGLYKAGGLDTHGESIFYNGERLITGNTNLNKN